MYNPNLEPKDLRDNLFVAAVILEWLNTLALERELNEKLNSLCLSAWKLFEEV